MSLSIKPMIDLRPSPSLVYVFQQHNAGVVCCYCFYLSGSAWQRTAHARFVDMRLLTSLFRAQSLAVAWQYPAVTTPGMKFFR